MKREFKGTGGEWDVEVGEGCCFHEGNRVSVYATGTDIVDEDDEGNPIYAIETIAEVWPGGTDIADGVLIAAAPELLAACEMVLAAFEGEGKLGVIDFEMIRKAVEKATFIKDELCGG